MAMYKSSRWFAVASSALLMIGAGCVVTTYSKDPPVRERDTLPTVQDVSETTSHTASGNIKIVHYHYRANSGIVDVTYRSTERIPFPVPGQGGGVEATETLEKAATLAGIRTVQVRGTSGSITVVKSADDRMHLTAVRTVTSATGTRATLVPLLKKVAIAVEADGTTLHIGEQVSKYLPDGIGVSVSYTIAVPASLALDVKSDDGNVAVRGVGVDVTAASSYGSIALLGSRGAVDVHSDNGQVTVADLDDCDTLDARSGYGAVTLKNITARRASAHSDNGRVTATDCRIANGTYRSGYGSIVLERMTGAIDAQSDNGQVTVDEARLTRLALVSGYGSVKAVAVQALGADLPVRLKSENGRVDFVGPASSLELTSGYGSITARLTAGLTFTGATVHSDNGTVHLTVPQALRARCQAQTENGSLTLENLSNVSVRASDEGGTVKKGGGSMNGGSALLRVSSEYGSVTVRGE